MNRHLLSVVIACALAGGTLPAQTGSAAGSRVELGRLTAGATVSFTPASSGQWGIEISGGETPPLSQPKLVQLEVFRLETDIRQLAAGYKSVEREGGAVIARAEVAYACGTVSRRSTTSPSALRPTRLFRPSPGMPGGGPGRH
jgi:hypothetical protein